MSEEKKISESCLSEKDKNALAMLSPGELHILSRLLELHPIDEAWSLFELMQSEKKDSEIPTYHFSNPDPYAERELPSADESHVDEAGNIRVQNPSAYWLPEIKLSKEIGGTVYFISGSYDGIEPLDRKLERIMEQNMADAEAQE